MNTTARSTSEDYAHIEVINRQRLKSVDRKSISGLSKAVLEAVGRGDAAITVVFVRDRFIQKLNREYRGIDRPTDVLSFGYNNDEISGHLGDVVISVETAERYAAELGLNFEREIEHLVIHGTLHLAGFDHETDDGEMNRLEKRLRRELLRESSFQFPVSSFQSGKD